MDAGARADGPDLVPEAAEPAALDRTPASPGSPAPSAHAAIARAFAAGAVPTPASLERFDPAARATAVHGMQRTHGNQAVARALGPPGERAVARGTRRRRGAPRPPPRPAPRTPRP